MFEGERTAFVVWKRCQSVPLIVFVGILLSESHIQIISAGMNRAAGRHLLTQNVSFLQIGRRGPALFPLRPEKHNAPLNREDLQLFIHFRYIYCTWFSTSLPSFSEWPRQSCLSPNLFHLDLVPSTDRWQCTSPLWTRREHFTCRHVYTSNIINCFCVHALYQN